MRQFEFVTVDVFTEERFAGNQLAVFHAAAGLEEAEMQSLAAELNLSETTFVLPPTDPRHDARVRIFNRVAEMAFAGHPCIGTAFVLSSMNSLPGSTATLEVPAGVVRVELERDATGTVVGAMVHAPVEFRRGGRISKPMSSRGAWGSRRRGSSSRRILRRSCPPAIRM